MGCGASTIPRDQQVLNAMNTLATKVDLRNFTATGIDRATNFKQL